MKFKASVGALCCKILFEIRVKVILRLVIAGYGFYERAELKLINVLVGALIQAAFTELKHFLNCIKLTQHQLLMNTATRSPHYLVMASCCVRIFHIKYFHFFKESQH